MSKVDWHKIAMPFVEEAIGLATLLVPEPKVEEVRILTDVESAELNTERIKLAKKVLEELRENSQCPKCVKKTDAALVIVNELVTEIPSYERIARLRQNLRQLLDEVKEGLPLLSEQQMASLKAEGKVEEKKE